MKLGFISAAAMLTLLPGAALADSATYTAVYSPALDVTTRSCEITKTGVEGQVSAGLGGRGSRLNQLSGSNNTAIMRTIGKDEGTAESTAGIQFGMVGANIVAIERAEMYAERGTVNTSGTIKVNLPNARVDVSNSNARELGFTGIKTKNATTVSEVSFANGLLNTLPDARVGSVVVGSRKGGEGGRELTLNQLANNRSSGRRTGTVKFTMTNIDRDTPTTVMSATISCEPVPVVRNENELDASQKAGLITAIRGPKTGEL